MVFLSQVQAFDNGLILVALGQSIGATIGFNMNRRYNTPSAEVLTGFIDLGKGKMSFAAPLIYIRPNPFISGDWVPTIDLVRVKF